MSRQYTLQRAPTSNSIHVDYAAELNQQQVAAVPAPPGPLLGIAGAGSGKTRALTHRVAYLLENGIDPRNILLLIFTNKAAREMLGRVASTQSTTPLPTPPLRPTPRPSLSPHPTPPPRP